MVSMIIKGKDRQQWCCPFCCFGTIDPHKAVLLILTWDMIMLILWFVHNFLRENVLTIAPMIVQFIYMIALFPVVFDLKNPDGQFKIVKFYSYFRIFCAVIMSLFALANFVLLFVFIADQKLQTPLFTLGWSLVFLICLIPGLIIEWGTILGMKKALKNLISEPLNDLKAKNIPHFGPDNGYGNMIGAPRVEFSNL